MLDNVRDVLFQALLFDNVSMEKNHIRADMCTGYVIGIINTDKIFYDKKTSVIIIEAEFSFKEGLYETKSSFACI